MGLGKTLTVISLILTNYYDGRPLCKPEIGYVRPQLEILRQSKKGGRRKAGVTAAKQVALPDLSTIGSKIKKNTEKKSIFSFFDNFKVRFDLSGIIFLGVHITLPAVLQIRIHFLWIRIWAWKLNTDPDPSQYHGDRKFICPYR